MDTTFHHLAACPLDEVQRRIGHEWPAICRARAQAAQTGRALEDHLRGVAAADASVVVYGSLARQEWTQQSDVDWTLLVDGPADPAHLRAAKDIERRLEEGRYNKPGPTGVFGNMTFSHDLFNKIGGSEDTNENTTQRILLLLESRSLNDGEAYNRVIDLILGRYLEDDRGLLYGSQPHKVPRYLVNDIVRYWRTIAVDFVDKQRGRGGRGWALRNAKLRLSRKLIFVAGLLTCFSCDLWSPAEARQALTGTQRSTAPMARHLREMVARTPLQILAQALLCLGSPPETARGLLDPYDAFLAILDDQDKRAHLSGLDPDHLSGDGLFIEVSRLGRRFQEALVRFFFREHERLSELTMIYGVF